MNKLAIVLLLLAVTVCLIGDTLTGGVTLTLDSDLIPSSGWGSARERINYTISRQFTSGTGAAAIDTVFTGKRELASGASESLDLVGGVTDGLGRAVTFGHVKALAIENLGTTTITLGSGSLPILFLDGATNTATIHASGTVLFLAPNAGYLASASLYENIHVEAAAGGTATYRIWAIGTSI
jgi:hypothetical protein